MHGPGINIWATLAAAAVNFVLGGLWYSPLLFVRPWLAMSGISKETFDSGLVKGIAVEAMSSFVMAWVLAGVELSTSAFTLADGLLTAFLLWLGFVATV